MRKRIWSGGAYPNREGIEASVCEGGIILRAWYDGGVYILRDDVADAVLTWDDLARMRNERRRNGEDATPHKETERSSDGR
jgi:hypothetical protein